MSQIAVRSGDEEANISRAPTMWQQAWYFIYINPLSFYSHPASSNSLNYLMTRPTLKRDQPWHDWNMCSTQSTICVWSPQARGIIVGDCESPLRTPQDLCPSPPLFLSLAALLSFHPFYQVLSPLLTYHKKQKFRNCFWNHVSSS